MGCTSLRYDIPATGWHGNIEALRVGLPVTLIKLVQGNRRAAGDPDGGE